MVIFLLYRNEKHIVAVVTFSLMVHLSGLLHCTDEGVGGRKSKHSFGWLVNGTCKLEVIQRVVFLFVKRLKKKSNKLFVRMTK